MHLSLVHCGSHFPPDMMKLQKLLMISARRVGGFMNTTCKIGLGLRESYWLVTRRVLKKTKEEKNRKVNVI
jgi:hypothetical protein